MVEGEDRWTPVRFFSEEIEALHNEMPALLKKPDPPDGFRWRQDTYEVEKVLSRWFDFERKGRMARNMKPENLRTAGRRGSWGVGRFYFRVSTKGGRVFDLYYDRAPEDAGDRGGHWYLWRELERTD
jgi:hypothetical protein